MNGRLEHDNKIEEAIDIVLSEVPDYVQEWILNLKASGKTASTRRNYLCMIKRYLSYINEDATKVKLSDINEINIQKYFISLQTTKRYNGGQEKETSDSYKCQIWAALNNFFVYMIKRGYMQTNPVLIIDKPKNHDLGRINQSRKLLTEKDFKKMLKAIDDDYNCDYEFKSRNKAILLLFMTTGMRKTALEEINIEDMDLDLEQPFLQIIDKRKKIHTYPINSSTEGELRDWIGYRARLLIRTKKESDALFLNKYGDRLSSDGVQEVVKRYSRLGLGYEISPHKLRSGLASILYNKTHDLEFVRRSIGHSDISTTTRYVVTEGKERETTSEMMNKLLD